MRNLARILLTKCFGLFKNHQIRGFILKIIIKMDDYYLTVSRKVMKDFYDITIGKKSYGCFKTNADIEPGSIIGSFCSFAPGVILGGMNHPLHYVSTHPFLYDKKFDYVKTSNKEIIEKGTPRVIIEDDVWIGRNAIINAGVTVGRGAVIASGAVVTENVEPYTIVGGVPAKEIKKRFSEQQIKRLMEIDWANWNQKEIQENLEFFYDVNKFTSEFTSK